MTDGGAAGASGRIVIGYNVNGTSNQRVTLGYGSNKVEIDIDGSDTSWAASSDVRLKENIQDSSAGLSFINDLRPVTFDWKKRKDITPELDEYYKEGSEKRIHGKEGKTYHGFIAQEIEEAISNHSEVMNGLGFLNSRDDGVLTAAPSALVPILVKSIQELSAKCDSLQNEINTLKGE